MASKVAFQDRMVVRVKDEREAYGNCTDNHGRSIGESFESKYDSSHIREQVMRGEKTVQGEESVNLTMEKLVLKTSMKQLTLLKFLAKLFC